MIKEIKQGHESQFLKGPSCIKTLKFLNFIELKPQINNNKHIKIQYHWHQEQREDSKTFWRQGEEKSHT